MSEPTISERMFEDFLDGKTDTETTRLADAAPNLLKMLTAALPLIDDAYHKAKREFADAPNIAEAFRLQAESSRAAISEATSNE